MSLQLAGNMGLRPVRNIHSKVILYIKQRGSSFVHPTKYLKVTTLHELHIVFKLKFRKQQISARQEEIL
jgi:hypothetical protein